jgi:hypothetical protein
MNIEQFLAAVKELGFSVRECQGEYQILTESKNISWHKWELINPFKKYDAWEVFGIENSSTGYDNQFCTSELECFRVILGELVMLKHCIPIYRTIGIETHLYAPELNKLALRNGDGKAQFFNCPGVADLDAAKKYVVENYKIKIAGYNA